MAKILIVDDNGLSRRTLRKILEAQGHEVLDAEDGIIALETYFISKPDLVMLDLTMNGMYGIDVLKKMREMDAGASVIVASADIQSSTLEMVTEAGARAFISKPFTVAKVLDAVNDVLGDSANGNH